MFHSRLGHLVLLENIKTKLEENATDIHHLSSQRIYEPKGSAYPWPAFPARRNVTTFLIGPFVSREENEGMEY